MANKEFKISETVADTFFEKLHRARLSITSLDIQIKQGYDDLERLQEYRLKSDAEEKEITEFLDAVLPADVWREKYTMWRERVRPHP